MSGKSKLWESKAIKLAIFYLKNRVNIDITIIEMRGLNRRSEIKNVTINVV